ncbi:hypothetical protein CHRY9393_03396 [Chryseobacterium fistulae]|uniref:Uncharacterized protein n=1 Tax=Chryseobacterium fistulae TaxID=2675058 RepID=A0A6N4XUY7_9FLAO|nr:hypothetical protein CHRY9393_03396 [Chryseobacterium fistulae]
MFFKQIFRNWLPCIYFFIGIFMYLFFLFLVFITEKGDTSWIYFTIGALSLNILNIGYYNFGFSFDYYNLINFKSELYIRRFLINHIFRIMISILMSSSIMILMLFVLNKIDEKVINIILCAICLIPIQILSYTLLFRKINLFDNKFVIIKQTGINYLTSILQIGFISLFYFLFDNIMYSILLLSFIYFIFFYKINSLVTVFINKINDEYIRS